MSLYKDASLVMIPSAYKDGKLYSIRPVPEYGAELVTNGDFATDSDWTLGTGWTISGGKAVANNASTNVTQNLSLIAANKSYKISFNISDYSGGQFFITFGGNDNTINFTANGDYDVYINPLNRVNDLIYLRGNSFSGSIDDVSVKEVSGYGTINGATWTHGIGAPVAQTSVIDWNKVSDGTNEVLIPQGLTAGRDLLGNLFENVRKQGALNLDGNSWAEVHDNGSLDFGTGSFTLEAWAKAAYVNQGSGLNTIFSLGGSSSGGNTMSLNIDSGLLPIIYYNGFYSVDSSAQTAGDWFHIVGTYDETNRTIYVNGVQVDQDAQTAVSITNALVKQIGRDTNANRLYQDQIAQPRIYNRALTAEEVQRNYNAGKNTYTN